MKNFFRNLFLLITAVIIIGASGGLAFAMFRGTQKLPVREYFSPAYTNSVWDWSNPLERTEVSISDDASWLYRHQFNTVYLDVSAVANGGSVDKMDTALVQYVQIMRQNKVQVFAAGGDTTWSKPEKRNYPLAVLEYLSLIHI